MDRTRTICLMLAAGAVASALACAYASANGDHLWTAAFGILGGVCVVQAGAAISRRRKREERLPAVRTAEGEDEE